MKYIKNISNWFLNLWRITFLSSSYKVYNFFIISELKTNKLYYQKNCYLLRTLYNNLKEQKQPIKATNYSTRQGSITIINSPHGNCQTFSIKNCNNLAIQSNKKIKEILFQAFDFTGKRQILIDIKKNEKKNILEKLNKYLNIVFEQEYISSNGSKMVLILLIKKS